MKEIHNIFSSQVNISQYDERSNCIAENPNKQIRNSRIQKKPAGQQTDE